MANRDRERIKALHEVYFAAGTVLLHMRASPGGDAFTYDGPTSAIDDLEEARSAYWMSLSDDELAEIERIA